MSGGQYVPDYVLDEILNAPIPYVFQRHLEIQLREPEEEEVRFEGFDTSHMDEDLLKRLRKVSQQFFKDLGDRIVADLKTRRPPSPEKPQPEQRNKPWFLQEPQWPDPKA